VTRRRHSWDFDGLSSDADSGALGAAKAALPRPGDRLAGLELRRELGRGGMGVVFAALDPGSGREVAVKVLTGDARVGRRRERFLREGQVLAALDDPGIVRVHAAVGDDGWLCLVCELVEGGRGLERSSCAGRSPTNASPRLALAPAAPRRGRGRGRARAYLAERGAEAPLVTVVHASRATGHVRVAFAGDATLVTAGPGPLRRWAVPAGRPLGADLGRHFVHALAPLPGGEVALVYGERVLRLRSEGPPAALPAPEGASLRERAASADGSLLAGVTRGRRVVLLDEASGRRERPFAAGRAAGRVALAPDGARVAVGSAVSKELGVLAAAEAGWVSLYDAATGVRIAERTRRASAARLAFAPGATSSRSGRASATCGCSRAGPWTRSPSSATTSTSAASWRAPRTRPSSPASPFRLTAGGSTRRAATAARPRSSRPGTSRAGG